MHIIVMVHLYLYMLTMEMLISQLARRPTIFCPFHNIFYSILYFSIPEPCFGTIRAIGVECANKAKTDTE